MVRTLRILTWAIISAITSQVLAVETTVIADHGGLEIKTILEEVPQEEEALAIQEEISQTDPTQIWQNGLLSETLYPVISNNLEIGPVGEDEATDIPGYLLTFPFFIVGFDQVSLSWIETNLELLKEKNAVGLVVNVENPSQMQEMMQLTGNQVPLYPTPGDDIALALNLRHYPVYIDHSGVAR